MKLMGRISNDLAELASVFGQDAFETGTGVHAAAVIKAFKKGDAWLADRIDSGVPAGMSGLEQIIRVGPMSEASTRARCARIPISAGRASDYFLRIESSSILRR